MASAAGLAPTSGRRRSVLDLAPFELDCMNALWPLEEATVRQVQEALVSRRPRAYTTIMTILDRLAQKGIVARRKVGRAYIYRANLQPADAQETAVEQIVEGFFGGSRDALAAHLAANGQSPVEQEVRPVKSVVKPKAEPVPAAPEPEKPVEASVADNSRELDRTLL